MSESATLLSQIEGFVSQFEREAAHASSGAKRPANIVLLGGRGTGKSTLLEAAATSLRSESRLVLPTVDPETLHAADSMMTWALSGLETTIDNEALLRDSGNGITLKKLINDLRRDYVLVSADMPRSLVQRGVGPAEYARDASLLTPIGMSIAASWSALLDTAASLLGIDGLLLILPIDDVDLHPTRLPKVLGQLELMRSSARFVPILAADEGTLINSLVFGDAEEADQWERAVRHGFARDRDLAELAEKKFTKHFPRQYRVRIRDVVAHERLNFAPTEAPENSLGDLLALFELKSVGLTSLRDLFEVKGTGSEAIVTSDYARALSGNRRDLQQLCSALSSAAANSNKAGHALSVIIEHGIETCRNLVPAHLRDAISISQRGGEWQINLNFAGMVHGSTVGRGFVVYSPNASRTGVAEEGEAEHARLTHGPALRLVVRRRSGFYIKERLDVTADAGEGAPERVGPDLPEMFTTLLALAWEAQEIEDTRGKSVIALGDLRGQFTLPGLRNWTGSISTGRDSPLAYLMVPAWEQFSDYFAYSFGWNALLDSLQDQAYGVRAVEFIILTHIRLVVDVQRYKTIPLEAFAPSKIALLADDDSWNSAYKALLEELREMVSAALASGISEGEDISTRSGDFIVWLCLGFPLASTRNICTARLSADLRDIWWDLPLKAQDRKELADFLGSRIPDYVTEARAEADIELLSIVDPARSAAISNVRQAIGERIEIAKRNALQSLQSIGVAEDILNRLQDGGAGIDILTSLNLIGVSRADLSRVAELFPPANQDSQPEREREQ